LVQNLSFALATILESFVLASSIAFVVLVAGKGQFIVGLLSCRQDGLEIFG